MLPKFKDFFKIMKNDEKHSNFYDRNILPQN